MKKADVELLIGGLSLVVAGIVMVMLMPGPDLCLPFRCQVPDPHFPVPFGPSGMSGVQIATLFAFLVGGSALLARAFTIRRSVIVLAAGTAFLVAWWGVGAATPIGSWYSADGTVLAPGSRPFLISVSLGSSHCGQQETAFLTMAWPPGARVPQRRFASQTREFAWQDRNELRDVHPVGDAQVVDAVPGDATYSGLHRGAWELWTSPSVGDAAVFLKSGSYVERWPRVDPPGCM